MSHEPRHFREIADAKRQTRHRIFKKFVGQYELVVARMARKPKKANVERHCCAHKVNHRYRRDELDAADEAAVADARTQRVAERWVFGTTDGQVKFRSPHVDAVDRRFE